MAAARAALGELTAIERRVLFLETETCTCANLAMVAVNNPATAVGGILGAALFEVMFPKKKVKNVLTNVTNDEKEVPPEVPPDPSKKEG